MERELGADFSEVRIHSNPAADHVAARLGASALTVGAQILFQAGAYRPGTPTGDRLLAHELVHVVQQADRRPRVDAAGRAPEVSDPGGADERAADDVAGRLFDGRPAPRPSRRSDGGPAIHRKIMMSAPDVWIFSSWSDFTATQRASFVRRRFIEADRGLAGRIVEDMADAVEDFKYKDEHDLRIEVFKRMRTSQLMRESQKGMDASGKAAAFGYPVRNTDGTWSSTCGPRVNKAASRYWGPMRFSPDGYEFPLSAWGQKHAYEAILALFVPQLSKCDRTLIHCDYLASVVHYRVFAETIRPSLFNSRVSSGTVPLTLKWNGFQDIEGAWFRSADRESIREVRPASERDLVIGDHVIFWNHRSYDLINELTREAWRLENAILVDRSKGGVDKFLGHGSGEQTKSTMLGKLVDRFNDVVDKARQVIDRVRSRDTAVSAAASKEMVDKFPNIKPVGAEWHVQGNGHGKTYDDSLARIDINDPDLIGLRDPEDQTRMNFVKRPMNESN